MTANSFPRLNPFRRARHSVSRCTGPKKSMCPILRAPVSAGVTVTMSG
jgi:hypothetical protein